jgi:protein tyrosine/serine phosphatase
MIEAEDDRIPPLTPEQLNAVWSAYQRLTKPLLVHCGAGVNRTGAAVAHIRDCLELGYDRLPDA